jgi:nucleoside-diphosphate-sugar epimerase|tara:strand:- start:974 stop:1207 length:234 start_codon:yes stop_codon:yes gene_type:complete
MTVLVCGANGSIGSFVSQQEAKTHKVVGTYRNHDDHAKELEKNPNITLIQKDMFKSTDMKDVVEKARHGNGITVNRR